MISNDQRAFARPTAWRVLRFGAVAVRGTAAAALCVGIAAVVAGAGRAADTTATVRGSAAASVYPVSLSKVASVSSGTSLSVAGIDVEPTTGMAYIPMESDDFAFQKGSPAHLGTFAVMSLKTNKITKTLRAGYQPIQVTYDANDHRLFVLNFAGFRATSNVRDIQVFDSRSLKLEATLHPPYEHIANANFGPMIFDDELDNLYVSMGNSQIDVINGASLKVTKLLPLSPGVGMAIDPTTQRFYGSNYNGAVWVLDLQTNRVFDKGIGVGHGGCYNNKCAGGQPSGTDGLTFDPATGNLYAANTNDGDVAVLDTKTNRVTGLLEPGLGQGAFMTQVDTAADVIYVLNDGEGNHTGLSVIDGRTHEVIDNQEFPGTALVTMAYDQYNHSLYVTTDPHWAAKPAKGARSQVQVFSTCKINQWIASKHHLHGITTGCPS